MHAAIAGAARDAELRCPLDVRGGFLQDIVGENGAPTHSERGREGAVAVVTLPGRWCVVAGTYDAIILGNVLCEVSSARRQPRGSAMVSCGNCPRRCTTCARRCSSLTSCSGRTPAASTSRSTCWMRTRPCAA
eukprot:scaffold65_cov353-Prasinococcus_capsulatus_cf.AAC.6